MTKKPAASPSRFTRAERSGVGCIIGIAAISGAGKTTSALRLARGLAADPGDDLTDPETLFRVDARIAVIDTERGRAKHKAAGPGQLPQPWKPGEQEMFGFFHAPCEAPFTPENYQSLIAEADEALNEDGSPRFRAIIVDSGSHEWDGEGGCHDIHDEQLDRDVEAAFARAKRGGYGDKFDEQEQRDKLSLGAWKPAKKRHKRFVGRLLQCRAHVIICMRAEDKMRIETEKKEKRSGGTYTATTITAPKDLPPKERWQPVCEKRLPYELLTSFVLSPDRPGFPITLKAEEAHRPLINENEPLDEELGRKLAAWASGASVDQLRPGADRTKRTGAPAPAKTQAPPAPPADQGPGDFPGDRGADAFQFALTDARNQTKTTTDGDKWADVLCGWLTEYAPERAAQAWARNEMHWRAADAASRPEAQRVWVAASKRGLIKEPA
ncbi:MAG: hypothetical protein NW206_19785 [Hyphomonadaceae bacterium]|nr:hypothetical protein [Hyphomonadaceae bacterium]